MSKTSSESLSELVSEQGVQPNTAPEDAQTSDQDWNEDSRTIELFEELEEVRKLCDQTTRDNSKLIEMLRRSEEENRQMAAQIARHIYSKAPESSKQNESWKTPPLTVVKDFSEEFKESNSGKELRRNVFVVNNPDYSHEPIEFPTYVLDTDNVVWAQVNVHNHLWRPVETRNATTTLPVGMDAESYIEWYALLKRSRILIELRPVDFHEGHRAFHYPATR